MPFFSIIIPTYNSELTLDSCLNSVYSQTWQNFEVWIIDGCSKDGTISLLRDYKNRYSNLNYITEPDNGIYDAMNKGIKRAKGNWLYFLGSDDELYSNKTLENISIILYNTKIKVVYGNVLINGDAGWAADKTVYDYEFNLEKLLKRNICHQAIFYKKEILNNTEFNIDYSICADYDLNLKLFSKYSFLFINHIIANFNGGGFSKKLIDEKFNHKKVVVTHFFNKLYLKEFYIFRSEIRNLAKTNTNLCTKFYLNLIYLKHLIFRNE